MEFLIRYFIVVTNEWLGGPVGKNYHYIYEVSYDLWGFGECSTLPPSHPYPFAYHSLRAFILGL